MRFILSLVLYIFFLGKVIAQSCPGSLLLDASNSVVDLPSTNQYYTGNNSGYTWECWFKLNQPFGTDMRPLISSVDGVLFEDQWFGFGWQGGWFNEPVTKLVFKVDGPNSTFPTGPNCSYQPTGGFILGTWYHAAGVMDYANQISKLYVNGALVDSKPITTPPITRVIPTQLGLNFSGTNMPLYGNMDEVRIWTRALSATEIASNYDKCLSGSEPNLFLYYRCNQPGGSNVQDASPNNNIGLFATSPNWSTQQPVITGTACASVASTFSANISSTCQGTNTSIASVTVSTNVTNPVFSYSWTNSSGVLVNQTNSSSSLTNSVSSLANGVYSLVIQMVTPCGITTSLTKTLTINCTNQSNIPPCVGIMTGTGMSICNQYSFSITPSQTITPLNYGNQGYACTGVNMPDVSFNILGATWRVMKNNWFFQSSLAGELRGYTSSGILQVIPFLPTNTITPINYSGTFVQFAINGVATGSLMNQATFSISLNSSQHSSNSYTFCPSSNPSVSISPNVPSQGGPWTYQWQPGGLTGNPVIVNPSNTTIYTVSATSSSGCISTTTVYVNVNCPPPLLCSGNLGNAVFMENFGSGTSLYGPALPAGTTNYIYQTGNPANGTYVISSSSNPSGVNLGYVNDGDHTGNPNGYMMVVNSDYPASEVYRKHVTGLCQNTTYVFSAYLSNNNTPSTPNNVCPGYVYSNVKFQIEYPLGTIQNSVTTGNLPLGLSNTALNWQQYGFVFTTLPGQTSVDIVLKNNAPGGCGNDYVVDDISLSPCGPGVALNIVPNQTIFCVGDAVSLQSNYTSGSYVNPQYQWQFSNDGGLTWTNIAGATSPNYSISSVSQSQSGSYQLFVAENGNINSTACSIVAGPISFSVSSGVSVSTSTTICSGNSAIINASGSNSYNWSNGATTNSVIVSPLTTTVYTVMGTVGTCTSQATSTVNVIPSSTISVLGNTLICAGQSTSLTASGATSYSWNTGSSTSSITVNPGLTTTYTASTTGSLCVIPAQITVSVVAVPNVSAGNNTVFCQGQSGVILTASGANTYTWSNTSSLSSSSSITVSATPAITTNYTLTGMNSLCTNTAVVTVSVNPSPTITAVSFSNTTCGLNNGEITINSFPTNNTYSWSSGVTSTTNTAVSLAAGIYTVNASNGICATSTVVTILNSQPLTILSNSVTPSDCGINNGNISVVTNYTNSVYSWTPSAINSSSISNLPAGSYSLIIVSGACSTSTVFNVPQLNGPTALLYNLSDALCESVNGSIVVTGVVNGVSPYQYSFNNTGYSSVNTFSNLSQGVYTITVKDAHGCVYSKTISIAKSIITSTINLTTNYPSCDTTDGSFVINSISGGTAPFLLSFNNSVFSTDSIFEDLGQGNYTLVVKDSNQCETIMILEMPIDKNDYTLYIPNTFTPNKDIVNDTWFVKGTCINAFNCLIFNRWGEKIIELKDINEQWDGTYKDNNVPDGVYVYLIEAETNNGTIYKNGHITLFR